MKKIRAYFVLCQTLARTDNHPILNGNNIRWGSSFYFILFFFCFYFPLQIIICTYYEDQIGPTFRLDIVDSICQNIQSITIYRTSKCSSCSVIRFWKLGYFCLQQERTLYVCFTLRLSEKSKFCSMEMSS